MKPQAPLACAVKKVAEEEILPRYLRVARLRKEDGSLFTEADLATQEALERELRKIRDIPVIGEEMDAATQRSLWESEEVWCVDPIDGTSNFVNGIPFFAVSVALMRNG
ncbi:MAG TPA: inositol monophosphatase family protein, partial [Burkholderiales bacterium]|nr:inositol monophosphatase family protein [Burkholderiales bacterium]